MTTSVAATRTHDRTRLSALRIVLIAALLGNVLVGAVTQLSMRALIPPLAMIMALTLVIAALVATRWRWAPLLAMVWSVLAIVPGLLIKNVVGICEKMLAELASTRRHPAPVREMTVRETFQLWGADEWDALRTRFR